MQTESMIVNVSREHIMNGIIADPTRHPVALAIKSHLEMSKENRIVAVGIEHAYVRGYYWKIPRLCRCIMDKMDKLMPVDPFEFMLYRQVGDLGIGIREIRSMSYHLITHDENKRYPYNDSGNVHCIP